MGSSAWVLALALGLVAVHTVSATNYTLGGTLGWTNSGNINYTAELAAFTIKVGDSIFFNNYDSVNHSIVVVPTQLAYDTCDYTNASSAVILPPDYYDVITFKFTHTHFYVICAFHCLSGQKVTFPVESANSTPAPVSPPTPSPTGSTAPTPSSTLAPPPPPPPSPASSPAPSTSSNPPPPPSPASSPAPSTSSTPPPPSTSSTRPPPPTTTDTSPPSPPPPPSKNPSPFGIVRSDAAGIARFGSLTFAVVCALSCYSIL